VPNSCPASYSPFEGNCYKVDSTTRSWQEAENECVRENGHLADAADRAEQGFIALLTREANADLWIGLSDHQVDVIPCSLMLLQTA